MPVRRMFTKGSRRVIIRHAVSAWRRSGFGSRPQACSIRAQSRRMARNFATVRNSSASAASSTRDAVAGAGEVVAGGLQGAQVGDRGREHGAEFGRLAGAGLVVGAPVGQEGPAA